MHLLAMCIASIRRHNCRPVSQHSCTSVTSSSTTYASEIHRETSSRVFETCSRVFVSIEMLKCRLLKLLLDHSMKHGCPLVKHADL